MRKSLLWISVILLATLILAPGAAAQDQTVEEIINAYYEALAEALATGDPAGFMDFFAEDATMTCPALSPMPVEGKEMIEAAMWPGIYGAVGGATVEVDLIEIEGNQAVVYLRYEGAPGDATYPFKDTFEIVDGKIQSLLAEIGVEAPAEEPSALPETGGAGLDLLPGLLVLGGAALVALGRRFSSR